MECEVREQAREDDGEGLSDFEDSFIAEGLSSLSDSSDAGRFQPSVFGAQSAVTRLQAGKACHEKLKQRLFHAKECWAARRATE